MSKIPNNKKRAYLKWLIEKYGIIQNDVWVLRRIINSNVINRIHFVRTAKGKSESIFLKIGDQKWSNYGDIDIQHYETTIVCFLNKKLVQPRELLLFLRENPSTHLYLQVEYENSLECELLEQVIEPSMSVEDLLDEIEKKKKNNEMKMCQVNELIDSALDKRDFEELEKLRVYKATLLNEYANI